MAPTGVVTTWGYPMNVIANNFKNGIDSNGRPSTYQESITSEPVKFNFGKINKNICQMFLQNKTINPVTNRKIKKNGPVYKKLSKMCEETLGIFIGKKPPLPKIGNRSS